MGNFFRAIRNILRYIFGSGPDVLLPGEAQDGADVSEAMAVIEVTAEVIEADRRAAPAASTAPEPVAPAGTSIELPEVRTPRYLWCIDNGHGAGTAGKRSPKFPNGDQLFEYELTRDIFARMKVGLDALGIAYQEICPEVEGDVKLSTRVERAHQLDSAYPKFFLSLHANAFGNGSEWNNVSGIETWYYQGSTSGVRLASAFQRALVTTLGWNDRAIRHHVDPAKAFYILRKTRMPAVLTETGFYTNREECTRLLDPAVRQSIAQAHIDAIRQIEDEGISNIEIYSRIFQIG
ncbi:MAG: N-acetylmuramoyl-L-alanine amidase [Bacteroidota bacterium]